MFPADIIMDSNEKAMNSDIYEELKLRGLEVSINSLKVGDYLLLAPEGKKPILVERKTTDDFINSIIDSRLWVQAENLSAVRREENFRIVVIVEGDLSATLSRRKISETAVLRALDELIFTYNIPVIYTSSKSATVSWLIAKSKSLGRIEEKRAYPYARKKARTEDDKILYSLSLLVGFKTAKKLLGLKKSLKGVVNMSLGELLSVEGIGERKARKIFELFNKETSTYDNREGG